MLNPTLATLAFALLWTGYALRRKNLGWHAALMSTGMGLDVALVLTLELGKDAVATALGPSLTPAQYAHVVTSTLAVALYVPVFTLGWIRLLRPAPAPRLRAWHIYLGHTALIFRTLGFFFMFAMLGRSHP